MSVKEWLRLYWRGTAFIEACQACPSFMKKWSCPPGLPDTLELMKPFQFVEVIGVQVIFDKDTVERACLFQSQIEEPGRQAYGMVKKRLLEALILLETLFPQALSIMAGECTICDSCSRETGEKCRYPDRLRYSYSGLGFDLVSLSKEVLGMPLLWQEKGIPAYQVAIASLLHS